MAAAAESKPAFRMPKLHNNPTGWGPSAGPEQFDDTLYQPFSKADRLGRVADWTNTLYPQDNKRAYRQYQQYGAQGSTAFTYYHGEDESSFSLVDNSRQQPRSKYGSKRPATNIRRPGFGPGRGGALGLQNSMRAGTQNNQWNNQRGGRGGYYGQGRRAGGYGRGDGRLNRGNAWSVEVQPEWKLLEEIDFGKLNNLQMTVQDPEELGLYGNVGVFDRAFDTLTTKSDKALVSTSRFFNRVTAIDDPVLREHAKNGGQVFATDNVIAAIMSCTRSVYSFDIVVEKIGDKLFLYQRDNSDLDFLTVDETSPDPPHDDGDGSINAPRKLAVEATLVNQYFTQQVLKKNSIVSIGKSNPFLDTVPEKAEAAAVGYRYRRWNIGTDLNLVCRCEVDGLLVSKKPEELTEDTDAFVMVKALTEYDSKASGSLDWRQKLDIQRGALLATALKNNLFKVCRWAAAASLSGASQIRVGFVSRASPRDNTRHTVLGTSSLRPKELAQQINFQLSNGWAVLRTVIDACRKQTDGKYLLLKDPSKRSIVLYSIPQGTFEEASDDEEEEDDDTVNEFASDIAPSQADEAEQ